MADSDSMRACTRCGECKLPSEFYFDKRRGRPVAECKVCALKKQKRRRVEHPEKCKAAVAAWMASHNDRVRELAVAYRARHPERMARNSAEWRKRNPEKHKEFTLDWRRRNASKVKSSKAAWRAANKERSKALSAEWRAANPDKVRQHVRTRRARVMESPGVLSKGIEAKLFKLQQGKCPCCRLPLGDDFHVDHIKALARGGTNTDDNVQLLRAECNHKKHAKDPIEYMQERGFLL